MKVITQEMGRIVSQALQPGKSVCVVCGLPVRVTGMGKKAFRRYFTLCCNYTQYREKFVRKGECIPCDWLRSYSLVPLYAKAYEDIQADV